MSFFDIGDRVDRRTVTKRVRDALIKSGALDALCDHRAQLSAILDDAMPTKPTRSQRNLIHQTLLQLLPEEPENRVLPKIPAWSPSIRLDHEREALGCYVSHHPVRVHDDQLKRLQVVPFTRLLDLPDGKEVRIAGLITGIKRILTKRQQPMAFVHLEDQDRTLEVIVFPSLYRDDSGKLEPGTVIALEGILDQNDQGIKVKATRFLPLDPVA